MLQLRPVFNRLPVIGYQDNPIADALTSYYDERLVTVGNLAQDLHLNLNPATCPETYLDWLGFMVGMVQPYYNQGWKVPVKRLAVANANEIFKLRGTLPGINKALGIHGFEYLLFNTTDLKLPFTFGVGNVFGRKSDSTRVLLPLKYARNGYEFKEAQNAANLYSSVVSPLTVCYDKFYIGFSFLGDPLW